MGVHQFLSWLRARHPQAFRTSRKLRSVEEETFKREFFNNRHDASSSSSSSSDDDDDQNKTSSSSSSSSSDHDQNQNKTKKKTLSGSEDDYAVICLDINALLHEVATAVTTQNQTPGGTSKIQLLNKGTVEQEILIRLRKQIEDLIFVAGGDTLKLQVQQQQQQVKQSSSKNNGNNLENNNNNNFGVLTFDNLEETVANISSSNSNEPIKNAAFNGHNFRLFEHDDANTSIETTDTSNQDDAAALTNKTEQNNKKCENPLRPRCIEEQNLLPVDILLVIDGVAPIGKCPQQRERRATRKQPGTVQEKAQQLLIQAAEKRSGRSENIFGDGGNPQRTHRNKYNNNNNNGNFRSDEDMAHSSTAFSLYAGDMSSNSTTLASGASSVWDGNAITVGTPFMQQVCALLHYVGGALVKLYRNLRVFVSDASVPGEGEQKIFSALRSGMLSTLPLSYTTRSTPQNSSSNKQIQNTIKADENRRICVCSNDTDSIVMALLLTDEDLVKRPIDVWRTPSIQLYNLAAATAMQLVQQNTVTATASSPASSSLAAFQQQQQNATAWIFDMNIFIQEMKKAFDWREDVATLIADLEMKEKKKTNNNINNNISATTTSTTTSITEIRKRTFGGAMKSFAFMLSLFGGDFLPRVADLSIADGDLDDVIEVLSEELFIKEKWIVDPLSGAVNLQAMYLVLQSLNERKYGLNVVEKNNNNNSNNESGARRGRPGTSSSANFSLILGGDSSNSGNTFNPFAAVKKSNNDNGEISTDPAPQHLVSFWEGIVWVGRYFDGIIISWSWFFEAGAGTITSAFNTHHSAPKLKDLVKYPHAYLGKPVEMAAESAKMFQDQVEILQRGLGGQFLATKQRQSLSSFSSSSKAKNNNHHHSTTSSIPSQNLCRNVSASRISAAVAKILEKQEESDTFADVNPVAFAAVVLPYYSWANLLPRALGEELLSAYDRVRTQTLEEEKKEHERDDANPDFLAESEKLLDLKSDYAATGSQSEIDEKNAKLAKLFIRQQRNLKGFNPVKAVSSVMKLVINLRSRFSQEEQKMLNKKDMYKLGWARIVVSDISDEKNAENAKKNNESKNSFEIGNLFATTTSSSTDQNGNEVELVTLKQHDKLLRQNLAEMNPSNSILARIWNERILGGSKRNCLTVTDVFNLNLKKNQDAAVSTSILGEWDEDKFSDSLTMINNKNNADNIATSLPNFDKIAQLVAMAEKLGQEQVVDKFIQHSISNNNDIKQVPNSTSKADDDALTKQKIIDSSAAAATAARHIRLTARIGSIFIPSSVKFAGIYSRHGGSSSSSSTVSNTMSMSTSLLASFPTLANDFVVASRGAVAVMLQETVSVV